MRPAAAATPRGARAGGGGRRAVARTGASSGPPGRKGGRTTGRPARPPRARHGPADRRRRARNRGTDPAPARPLRTGRGGPRAEGGEENAPPSPRPTDARPRTGEERERESERERATARERERERRRRLLLLRSGPARSLWPVNDPSAGSPTETLLRLLLPLDSQVRPSSQRSARAVGRPRRGRSEGLTKPSNR